MKTVLLLIMMIFLTLTPIFAAFNKNADEFKQNRIEECVCDDREDEDDREEGDSDDSEEEELEDEDEEEYNEDPSEEDALKEVKVMWAELKKQLTQSNHSNLVNRLEPLVKHFSNKPIELHGALEELLESKYDPAERISNIENLIADFELMKLVEGYRQTKTPSQKSDYKQRMRVILKNILQKRLKDRKEEILELESELKRLKENLEKAHANPNIYIEKKIQKLTDEEVDPFEW